MFKINGILIMKIEKIKAHDRSIIAKIKKIFIEMNKKFSKEVNTKIDNEITSYISEIKASFTMKLGRINNEVDAKLERFINKLNN